MAVKHQRQVIRETVAALLAGKTAAGSRVFPTRMVPYRKVELPVIAIYTQNEPVDSDSRQTAPRELKRNLQLVIEGAVQLFPGNVDDSMDALALEIERVMHADPTFAGQASDSILANTDIVTVEEGDKPMGVVVLTYDVVYFSYAPEAADTSLDDLVTVNVKTSLGGTVHSDDQAEDNLNP